MMMGKIARHFQRGNKEEKAYLTPAEYERLRNEILDAVADQMMGDALLVVVGMLMKDWGKLNARDTRLQRFGEMFKAKLKEQSMTHSLDNLELLTKAGLRNISYGEG